MYSMINIVTSNSNVSLIQRLRLETHGDFVFCNAEYSASHSVKFDALEGKLGYLNDRTVTLGTELTISQL
jgi:hypothetical protein